MTALLAIYTPDGFAVGADSLRKDLRGETVTERGIKLHEIRHPDFSGVYGFTGITGFEFGDGRPNADIIECAQHTANELLEQRFETAQDYVDGFCNRLAKKIQDASEGVSIPNNFQLCGMFAGYAGNRPIYLRVVFPTVIGRMLRPQIVQLEADPYCGIRVVSGSQIVLDEMPEEPRTLNEAIDYIRRYVTACIENTTDPYCANIGGTPQVASITPNGFHWVNPPLG
jgi:hypothetical protein